LRFLRKERWRRLIICIVLQLRRWTKLIVLRLNRWTELVELRLERRIHWIILRLIKLWWWTILIVLRLRLRRWAIIVLRRIRRIKLIYLILLLQLTGLRRFIYFIYWLNECFLDWLRNCRSRFNNLIYFTFSKIVCFFTYSFRVAAKLSSLISSEFKLVYYIVRLAIWFWFLFKVRRLIRISGLFWNFRGLVI